MKLRSYLRGIGIGIIIATGLCIAISMQSDRKTVTMTDDEVIARAKELGMTEDSVLSELNVEPTVEVTEIIRDTKTGAAQTEDAAGGEETLQDTTDTETTEPVSELAPETTPTPESTPEPTPTPTPTPEPSKEPDKSAPAGDIISITVDKGSGSDTVAKKLEAAGLVADAREYDRWLMQNGYDRIIAAGTHEIPKGASNEEIARIICNR